MKKHLYFLLAFLFMTSAFHLNSAPAVFVPFKCPPGSAEKDGWKVYEDRNSNGYYDRVTTKHCDGTITVVDIPELVGGFKDTIGIAPNYLNSVIYDFSTYSCYGGTKPAWQVIAKDSSNLDEVYRVVCCGDDYQLITPEKISGISGEIVNYFSITDIIRIFPNPAKNELNIKVKDNLSGILLIHIINSLGDIVMIQEMKIDGNKEFSLKISDLANGNYFIKFVYGSSTGFIPLSIIR